MTDSKTKTKFKRAKKPEAFEITEEDYKMTIDEEEIGVTNQTYDTTPDWTNLKKNWFWISELPLKIFWLRQMQNKKN